MHQRLTEIIQLKNQSQTRMETWLVLGEVVAVHISKHLLNKGEFDTFGAGIILRAGGLSAYVEVTPQSRFNMKRPKYANPE
jgi:flavin reductase (DIM6/NTAB) family NADH-FMN oxidoreductase RutF